MSARSFSLVLGTAAGAFVAAGLIPLATAASARADGDDVTPGVDTDFMSGPLQDFGLFTDQSFADPDDNEFVATIVSNQSFTDVLTSGADPSDSLAALGAPGDTGIGVVGETINTFIDPSDPALDSTIVLPFTDPLAQLFTDLLPLGF
jgi:hypothetical protein